MRIHDVLVVVLVCEPHENGIESRSLSSSSRLKVTGILENSSAYSREKEKIINNYSFERVLNFRHQPLFVMAQQETIKWSGTFAGHRVTNFTKHCCKTEVFNNTVSNNWKVNAARTEKKLLKNRDNNNYRFRENALLRSSL